VVRYVLKGTLFLTCRGGALYPYLSRNNKVSAYFRCFKTKRNKKAPFNGAFGNFKNT